MRLEERDIALRPFTDADVPAIVEACQDPEIPRWTSIPSPYSEDDARKFLAGRPDSHDFAVVDSGTDELLGALGFELVGDSRGHFGYWLKKEARGRGIASRALRLLARWATTECGLARLQLVVEPGNVPSITVAERAGFEREGLLRSYLTIKGTRRDVYMYSLLAEDFR